MVDVAVNFTLENEEPVNVDFALQPDVTYTADIKTETATKDHDKLRNRDLPNQHPIEAITGLEDILGKLWTFTYEQASASDSWLIVHNLGRKPRQYLSQCIGQPDKIHCLHYLQLLRLVFCLNYEQ